MKNKILIILLCLTSLTFISCSEKKQITVKSIRSEKITKKKEFLSKHKLTTIYENNGLVEEPKYLDGFGSASTIFNTTDGKKTIHTKRAGFIIDGDSVVRTFIDISCRQHSEEEFRVILKDLLNYATPSVNVNGWLDYMIPIAKKHDGNYFNWEIDNKVIQFSYYTGNFGSSFLVNVADSKYKSYLYKGGTITELNKKGKLRK